MDDARRPPVEPGAGPQAIEAWNRWYDQVGRHLDFYGEAMEGTPPVDELEKAPDLDQERSGLSAEAAAAWNDWITKNGMPLEDFRHPRRDTRHE